MHKLITFSFFLVLTSCSSFDADARAEWKIVDNPHEDKEWRICSEQYDGAEFHKKGFCYRIKECRKRLLRKLECRPVPLFCAWNDLDCYEKYRLFGKTLR